MSIKIFKEPECVVIWNNGLLLADRVATPDFSSFDVVHLGGVAYTHRGPLEGDFSAPWRPPLPASDIRDAMGEWSAVGESSEEYLNQYVVFSDAYGYGATFYSVVPGIGLIVSDSFQGVSAALMERNIPPALDEYNYLTTVSLDTPTFNNAHSSSTMHRGIRILEPDEALWATEDGVHLVERGALGGSCDIRDYEEAVDAGVAHSKKVLQGFAEVSAVGRRLTLSGGVDSRLALALMIDADVHHEFSVFSSDPRGWSNKRTRDSIECDIDIANAIRESLGMAWWTRPARDKLPMSYRESLALYQGRWSSISYKFSPSHVYTMNSQVESTVRGGGGEILRSFDGYTQVGARFREYSSNNPRSALDEATWVAQQYLPAAKFDDAVREGARERFARFYSESQGESPEERMNSYYFRTRNRAHFGHHRATLASRDVMIHPLSNPFLLRASRLLPFERRAEGDLVMDIFRRSAPQLLRYPFESSKWDAILRHEPRHHVRRREQAWRRSLDEAIASADGESRWIDGHRGKAAYSKTFDSRQSGLNYIKRAFASLEEMVPHDDRKLLSGQHRLVLSHLQAGKLSLGHVAAKAASALDVFLPSTSSPRQAALHCRRDEWPDMPALGRVEINGWAPTVCGHNGHEPFEQNPTLEYDDQEFRIAANPLQGWEVGMDFAFYLYRDGKRVQSAWYTSEPTATIHNEWGPGTYMVRSFVRPSSPGGIKYIADTSSLHVKTA